MLKVKDRSEVSQLVHTYYHRYRYADSVDWDTWVADQERRFESQAPIHSIAPLPAKTLEAVLCDLPEPAYQEVCTTAFVADYLLSRGARVIHRPTVKPFETELVIGEREEATVGIRCDLDAVSQGNGHFKHTCGHSLNIAAAVKTWEILHQNQRFERLWLVFQPAEEGPGLEQDGHVHPEGLSGGIYLRKRGIFEKIENLISCHVDTALKNSEVRITEGAATASANRLKWHFPGLLAHAALPWEGHNPMDDLRGLLIAVKQFNDRLTNLESGSYGLISPTEVSTAPGEVNSLRAWIEVQGISRLIGEEAERLFEQFCSETGAQVALESPPVWNSPGLALVGRRVAQELGFSVVEEPARFRDETAWACHRNVNSVCADELPNACKDVLHFFVSGGDDAGSLHSDGFRPDVPGVLRSQSRLMSRIAADILAS